MADTKDFFSNWLPNKLKTNPDLVKSINAEERRFGLRACVIQLGETDTPIMQVRPFPPAGEALKDMLKPEDVAAAVLFVVTLPPHVSVPELVIKPTVHTYW